MTPQLESPNVYILFSTLLLMCYRSHVPTLYKIQARAQVEL